MVTSIIYYSVIRSVRYFTGLADDVTLVYRTSFWFLATPTLMPLRGLLMLAVTTHRLP